MSERRILVIGSLCEAFQRLGFPKSGPPGVSIPILDVPAHQFGQLRNQTLRALHLFGRFDLRTGKDFDRFDRARGKSDSGVGRLAQRHDYCRQQGQALIEQLILYAHDLLEAGHSAPDVFAGIFARQQEVSAMCPLPAFLPKTQQSSQQETRGARSGATGCWATSCEASTYLNIAATFTRNPGTTLAPSNSSASRSPRTSSGDVITFTVRERGLMITTI